MKRSDFMTKAYSAVQRFEKTWNQGQRGDDPDSWPDEMPEQDWWEQIIMHIEGELNDEP